MMKIAAMVGAPDLQKETLALFSGDLQRAFQKLSKLGYDGVELMTRNPQNLDIDQIKGWLTEEGLQMVGFCTGHVYGEDSLGLVGPDPRVCEMAFERFKSFIKIAGDEFGSGTLINIGRVRGTGIPCEPALTLSKMADTFHSLAELAAIQQVTLVLEPINIHQTTSIHTTQEGIKMVDRVNHPNFRLMIDTYHMNIEDVDIHTSIQQAGGRIKFVHFADNNRKYPGNAHINFEQIVHTLVEISYDGFISLEIFPLPDPLLAATLSISFLRRFIPKQV